MEFLDDTGSDGVTIFEDDLLELTAGYDKGLLRCHPFRHVLGYHPLTNADMTTSNVLVVAVQINMWGEENGARVLMKDKWEEMTAFVQQGCRISDKGVGDRLMGNWPRSMFWVGSGPTQNLQFLASSEKDGLSSILPNVAEEEIESYVSAKRPRYAAQWSRHIVNGLWHWFRPSPDTSQRGLIAEECIENGVSGPPILPPMPSPEMRAKDGSPP